MNIRHLLFPSALAIIAVAVASPTKAHSAPKSKRVPTYAQDVAPILDAKCAVCHHAGEVTPFNLTSYEEARAKAPTIVAAIQSKYMPPWQALSHGQFSNERSLTEDQIATIAMWSKAGSPKGDLKLAPPTPKFTPGWIMGEPDFVGKPDRPYEVAAEGEDDYRCFVIPTHYSEGRFVTGIEVRPGNRRVVHHVLIYLDDKGIARAKDGKDGKPGYASFGGPGFTPVGALGGWAPGLQPQILPPGNGFWLPKGADIVLQLHYHKDGKPETDLTQVGLKFAKGIMDKQVRWGSVHNVLLRIPAGDPHAEVTAQTTLDSAVTLLDVIPHMHWLGHDMKVTATLPDGSVKELINVQPYDFNWQTRYAYKDPVHLPAGTVLNLVAHYDNTSNNPRNPHSPPQEVTFGEQTTNEMCFAFFSYTYDKEHLTKGITMGAEKELGDDHITIDKLFAFYDEDHDGYLNTQELTKFIQFLYEVRDNGTPHPSAETSAKFAVAIYGKTQKGKMNHDEFMKMVMANIAKAGKS